MEQTRRGGWLGRAVVVLIVWVALASAAYYLVVVLPGGDAREATGDEPAPIATPADDPDRAWSAEAIAAEPEAFLAWAAKRADDAIAERERRASALSARRADLKAKAGDLAKNLADAENVHQAMTRGFQRAEDEGRWPMRVAGRSFDKPRAEAVIARTGEYLETHRPLRQAYDEVTREIDASQKAVREALERLRRLRERIGVDLEVARLDAKRVDAGRLVEANAELAALRKEGAGETGGDAKADELRRHAGERLDVDALLK